MSMTYRPEIDGLRAIAVLAVLFYHAEFFGFGGGFIGVDVFFVISGFLITNIILREIDAGKFSYANFYERRARRILPMVFTVIIAAIPLGLWTMLTDQFEDFADSIISSIFFYSNFFFLNEGGYWGDDNALKPLLHTWSLAVEEQFYILFPPILFLCWKFFRTNLNAVLITGFVISLVTAHWASHPYPLESFFMLPTRAFELLAGAMLATQGFKGVGADWRYGRLMPVLGILMIIVAVIGFQDTMLHPSFMTLLPVIGSMLIIQFGGQGDVASKLLSTKVFVSIGLISYSLYLWHHMLFAFTRIKTAGEVSELIMTGLIILSFVLSYLSWRFIETPFRNKKTIPTKKFWIVITCFAILLPGFALIAKEKEGFPSRLPALAKLANEASDNSAARLRVDGESCDNRTIENTCVLGPEDAKRSWVLLGDSHFTIISQAFWEAVDNRGDRLTAYISDACFYAPGMEVMENGKRAGCGSKVNERRRDMLLQMEPQIIVIGGRLPLYISGEWFDNGEGGVEDTTRLYMQPQGKDLPEKARQKVVKEKISDSIKELLDAGHKVVLIYPIPEVGAHAPRVIGKHIMSKSSQEAQEWLDNDGFHTSYDVFVQRNAAAYDVYDSLGKHRNMVRVYPEKIFCNTTLEGRCMTHGKEGIYYSDDDHLSVIGSRKLVSYIMQVIENRWGQ